MEVEQSSKMIAKRLWNVVRIVLYMVKKGISKSKLMQLQLDHLQMMLIKRGKFLGKAIQNLMLQHQHYYAAFTCKPHDVHMSYISPTTRGYEFSCSNTPVVRHRRLGLHHHHQRHQNYYRHREHRCDEVFDVSSDYGSSPALTLPGFGRSPMVRQLRVTDSPFSLKEMEDNDSQVDKDAEEFINKFYKDLKKQRRIAVFESPSTNCHVWS